MLAGGNDDNRAQRMLSACPEPRGLREALGKHAKDRQGSKGSRAFPWMAATALLSGYNFMLLRGEL